MRKVLALVRVSWLSAASYRVSVLLSLVSLVVTIVPLYFVANAIQPVIADSIQSQGGEYFAFILIGMIAFSFLSTAVNSLPSTVSSGIGSGTLEALFSTPTSVSVLLTGMIGYGFAWTAARAVILFVAGVVFGADFVWDRSLIAGGILLLIVLAYLPFGLLAAAMVLAFKTSAFVPRAVLVLSGLLGGVYYPTKVIPSWIQSVSEVLPLTYGLRALRQTLLEGMPLSHVASDVTILLGFVVVLSTLGFTVFGWALSYAKSSGTLSQY
jgi:ABC-2 type transport system permease protein